MRVLQRPYAFGTGLRLLSVGFWLFLLVQPAPAGEEYQDEEGHGEEELHLEFSPEVMAEFGIEVDTAGPGIIRKELVVPGEVAVNGNRIAHIAPRFPGIVTEVRKTIGDFVQKGEVLALVESNEALTPYPVKSLLSGVVIERHLTVGEVHTGDTPAFVVADLDTVWINLSVYQWQLPLVQYGQAVTIIPSADIPPVRGRISYISPIVDEHTRTATARVVMPNPDGTLRPGLFVEGRIVTSEERVPLWVPRSALQTMEGSVVVFIRSDEGFRPQPVSLGRRDAVGVEIVSGLEPGQEYVSKGGFTLKAEMLKGAFGGGHGH